jgi:hypothetical protein
MMFNKEEGVLNPAFFNQIVKNESKTPPGYLNR